MIFRGLTEQVLTEGGGAGHIDIKHAGLKGWRLLATFAGAEAIEALPVARPRADVTNYPKHCTHPPEISKSKPS